MLTISGTFHMTTETMIVDASQEADGLLRFFGGKGADLVIGLTLQGPTPLGAGDFVL